MRLGLFAMIAAVVSTAAFAGVLAGDGSPHLATLLRLAIATPILYLALARTHHPVRAALAVGAATGAKLMLEPLLVTLAGGHEARLLVPLASDLGYGALITYVMLRTSSELRRPSASGAPAILAVLPGPVAPTTGRA